MENKKEEQKRIARKIRDEKLEEIRKIKRHATDDFDKAINEIHKQARKFDSEQTEKENKIRDDYYEQYDKIIEDN